MENELKERNDLIRRGDAIDLCEMAIDDSWEYDYATDRMFEIPAVDAVEVRHGEWDEYDDDYGNLCCSVCEGNAPDDIRWDYCPHCGARMDGEEVHNALD